MYDFLSVITRVFMSNVSSSVCVFLILAGVAGVVLAYIIYSIRQPKNTATD